MSLVPYAPASAAFFATEHGAQMAREAYRDAKWAARKIGKSYKKYQQRRKSKPLRQKFNPAMDIGEPISKTGTTRRVDTPSIGVQSNATHTLYTEQIQYPTFGANIDQRDRQMIHLKGLKLCMEFRCLSPVAAGQQLLCNMALIASKVEPTAQTVDDTFFFRANNDNRARAFGDISSSIDKHCSPINTDRFTVFFHKRFVLGAPSSDDLPNYTMVDKYVPIKRQIRFNSQNQPTHRLFVVWWFVISTSNTLTPTTGVCSTQWNHLAYFRNVCD